VKSSIITNERIRVTALSGKNPTYGRRKRHTKGVVYQNLLTMIGIEQWGVGTAIQTSGCEQMGIE